jgi:hypothetical protein
MYVYTYVYMFSRCGAENGGGKTKRQRANACLYKLAIYVWNGFVESMVFEEFRGSYLQYIYTSRTTTAI